MISFSKKQLVEFLKSVGLKEKDCLVNGEVIDLFKLLKFKPKINDDGSRTLSPYEILRVSPKFRNGKEIPIVFAIKNRAKSIGKYKGQELVYYYNQNVAKNEKTIIEIDNVQEQQLNKLRNHTMHHSMLLFGQAHNLKEAKDNFKSLEKQLNAFVKLLPEEYRQGFLSDINKLNGRNEQKYLNKFYLEITDVGIHIKENN